MLGALVTLPDVKTLPTTFKLDIPDDWILTQVEDDCAGHATSLASSYQEGVRLEPDFTWVMAREIQHMKPDEWGLQLRDAMHAHVKIGAIQLKDKPYDTFTKEWRSVAKWNVSELLKKSVHHKKGSFTSIEQSQGMDMYDTIKASLYKFKTPIVIGLRWPYGTEANIDKWIDGGYGHAVTVIGWTETGLIIVNSWGLYVGDLGRFYFPRDIINKEVPRFGAGVFIDETPEKLREYVANGIKLDTPWIVNIINTLLEKAKELLDLLKKEEAHNYIAGIPPYKWDTPANARHSVRVICDEEGLTWEQKEIIAACIKQESAFKNWVKCENKDKDGKVWSTDHGICQINDYWNIGKNRPFPSVEYVMDNPDKVVRWMIKMMRAGKLSLWASYSSGAYKKYINNNKV